MPQNLHTETDFRKTVLVTIEDDMTQIDDSEVIEGREREKILSFTRDPSLRANPVAKAGSLSPLKLTEYYNTKLSKKKILK